MCDGSSCDEPPPPTPLAKQNISVQFQCDHALNIPKTFSLNAVTLEQRVL